MGAQITTVATVLPSRYVTSARTEAKIAERSTGFRPPPGLIQRATGIAGRHVAPADWHPSDLAAAAAAKALAEAGLTPADIDLLIFASASQDMVEPATAHITADLLGARCPVFDIKNACNSVLNGLQVADALITAGQHRRVLVCSGETPSRGTRWQVRDLRQFAASFAGYTLSDNGSALLLEAAPPGHGILRQAHTADSSAWRTGTLPGGGSRHPRDPEHSYFELDGARLRQAFDAVDPATVLDVPAAAGVTLDEIALIAVHQVTVPYVHAFADQCGIPRHRLDLTVAEHGNCASGSLPLQLHRAVMTGRLHRGDLALLVGLAGGISVGSVLLRW